MKTIEKIIEYFEQNEDTFTEAIEELDCYNGYLGDDRYYEMEMLTEFYSGSDPVELLQRAFFGRDDENWYRKENGEKVYGPFNPNRTYFYYNGYGNLVSANYKDYSGYLDAYAVEAMLENREYIDPLKWDDELAALFDELEKENNAQ
jgi:hypothetical protein